jgi:hypothetical protein
VGAETARKESKHPAVTLPAERYLGDGGRCRGIFEESGESGQDMRTGRERGRR